MSLNPFSVNRHIFTTVSRINVLTVHPQTLSSQKSPKMMSRAGNDRVFIGQELIRRWSTRTWGDVSSYMITYLPLNYDTPVFPKYFLTYAGLHVIYLTDVCLRKAPCVIVSVKMH